jgi:hypothetical protein
MGKRSVHAWVKVCRGVADLAAEGIDAIRGAGRSARRRSGGVAKREEKIRTTGS